MKKSHYKTTSNQTEEIIDFEEMKFYIILELSTVCTIHEGKLEDHNGVLWSTDSFGKFTARLLPDEVQKAYNEYLQKRLK